MKFIRSPTSPTIHEGCEPEAVNSEDLPIRPYAAHVVVNYGASLCIEISKLYLQYVHIPARARPRNCRVNDERVTAAQQTE